MSEAQQTTATENADLVPRYGLRAGVFLLLADTDVSVQVVDLPRMCPFPNSPPGFRGVVNLRGDLVPVFDLGVLADEPPAERGKLAVCGDGSNRAALLVASMPGRIAAEELVAVAIPGARQLPPPLAAAVRGAAQHGDELWLEIDYPTLFRCLAEPAEDDAARTRVADLDTAENP